MGWYLHPAQRPDTQGSFLWLSVFLSELLYRIFLIHDVMMFNHPLTSLKTIMLITTNKISGINQLKMCCVSMFPSIQQMKATWAVKCLDTLDLHFLTCILTLKLRNIVKKNQPKSIQWISSMLFEKQIVKLVKKMKSGFFKTCFVLYKILIHYKKVFFSKVVNKNVIMQLISYFCVKTASTPFVSVCT